MTIKNVKEFCVKTQCLFGRYLQKIVWRTKIMMICSCYLLFCFVLYLMPYETTTLFFPISVLTQLNSRHQCFLLFSFPLKIGHVVFGIVKNHNKKFFYDCVASWILNNKLTFDFLIIICFVITYSCSLKYFKKYISNIFSCLFSFYLSFQKTMEVKMNCRRNNTFLQNH